MIYIPAGDFIMGSTDIDEEGLGSQFGEPKGNYYEDEKPEHTKHLDSFYIDKFEVTNKDYQLFWQVTKRVPPDNWKSVSKDEFMNHPVTYVSWFDARDYCKWIGKKLTTEAQWEKATRGTEGRNYPWGENFDNSLGHFKSGSTMPVGSYKTDKSPYGVMDLGGNVMEWVEDWYKPYKGNNVPNKHYGETSKVLRGGYAGIAGHYNTNKIYARGAYRSFIAPNFSGGDAGFRCAKSEKH